MTEQSSLEVWAIVKLAIAWIGTFLGALTLNGVLSTIVLVLTIVYTYYNIRKIRQELKRLEAVKESS